MLDEEDPAFRVIKAAGTGFGCLFFGQIVIGLAITGGLVYVALHFLAKVW
jgi:hypothetical protein